MRASLDMSMAAALLEVLDPTGNPTDAARDALLQARASLADAERAFAAADWATALTASLAALATFEERLAYSQDEAAWSLASDVFALRALTYLKIRKKNAAADATRALLLLVPDYLPDDEERELVKLVKEGKREMAALPLARLEVQSKPAGAQVLVDGRRRGKTPLVIEDLMAGVHYVAMLGKGGRYTERVVVDENGARVSARIGSKQKVDARDVQRTLEKPTSAKALLAAVAGVDGDGLIVVLMPAGKKLEVIGARLGDGVLKVVCGIRVPDNDNARERAAFTLVQALLEKNDDAWLDQAKGDTPAALRQRLLAGMGTVDIPIDETDSKPVSTGTVALGIIAGVLVVVVAGTAVGVSVARELKKNEGFTWTVDAAGLDD